MTGLGWLIVLFLAIVPLLLAGIGTGLFLGTDRDTLSQHGAFVAGGIGVLLMMAAVVLFAPAGPKPVGAVFIFVPPALVGFGLFTLAVAYIIWAAPDVLAPRWIAAMLVAATLVDPFVISALTHYLSVGISVTGLAWITTGLALRSERPSSGGGATAVSQLD